MQDIETLMFANMSKFKRLNENRLNMIMKKYDLRKIDVEIIIYLANCGERNTARDIAAMEMFTKGHISQSVKRMHGEGYIDIIHDDKDLRVQHLMLTDNSKEILEEMLEERREIEKLVFEGVTDKEMDILKNIFNKMCDNIMREMNK